MKIIANTPCLVLGGGGFIGTNLCRALRDRGAAVHGFGRRQGFPEALAGIRWTTGDFADRAALARAIEGQEVIFHLLGSSVPESSNRDPIADLMSSAATTLHLLELCRHSGARRLIFVSSGGTVYGVPRAIPIAETAPTDPISAYGVSKLAIEKYLYLYRHLYGLDYTILRVANPFGPYQSPERRQGVIAAMLHQAMRGRPLQIWGDGKVVRDFVYIGDVVDALIKVTDYAGEHRIFNVGSGIGRSLLEIIDDIEAVLQLPAIERQWKSARATDVPVNVLDIARIVDEIDWSPATDWRTGLERTAQWLKDWD